jgi:hypothetical protein
VTPFTPTDWRMTFDGESVSLDPSVGNWNQKCRSHYVIRRNRVLRPALGQTLGSKQSVAETKRPKPPITARQPMTNPASLLRRTNPHPLRSRRRQPTRPVRPRVSGRASNRGSLADQKTTRRGPSAL